MRGKTFSKSRSGSTTPPARDPDLLETDQILSVSALDELWEWFYLAYSDNLDPELIFVKLINSTRNPYKTHIPPGYKPPSEGQDLITLDQEDEKEQLRHLVTSLRAEIVAKEKHISSLETQDSRSRETEKTLILELASKDREIEKRNDQIEILSQIEAAFQSQKAEHEQEEKVLKEELGLRGREFSELQKKRDDLVDLLENINREQLTTSTLFRDSLNQRDTQLTSMIQTQKSLEDRLFAREKELQDLGNSYGRRLSEKEKELESKSSIIDELRKVLDSQEEIVRVKVGEVETGFAESRRELVQRVVEALGRKSLTPQALGLTEEEWCEQKGGGKGGGLGRTWSWR